jgi:hypothetical protein
MIRWRGALAERNAALRGRLVWNEALPAGEPFPLPGFERTLNFGTVHTVEMCAGFRRQQLAALELLGGGG